jgi:enoyl-CoA hydratase/carnithine racemase
VEVSVAGPVTVARTATATTIEFDDAANRNRLDDAMVDALHAALDAANPEHVLAFRGRGDGFSAGRPHSPGGHPAGPEAAKRALTELVRLNERVAAWKAPTLAFVHGYAHGAALGILQHCDIVVAAHGTRFSFPEITYNLPPGLVVSYLRRYLTEKPVRYLVMTGEEVDAGRAREMGLISLVVAADALEATAADLTAKLGARLEAEIALKATIADFSPWTTGLVENMTRGLEAVVRWTRRPKTEHV